MRALIKSSIMTVVVCVSMTLSQGVLAWGGSSYGDSSDSGSSWGDSSGGDSTGGWTAADCRSCHDDWQNLPLKYSNPDNHHKLLGTPVRHNTAPNASLSDHYLCMSCHEVDMSSGYVEYAAERNCLVCHNIKTVATQYRGNRHHDTQTARDRRCSTCHSRMPGGRSWR